MNTKFKRIALVGRQNREGVVDTLHQLIQFLLKNDIIVTIEQESADMLDSAACRTVEYDELAKEQDLIIVIGGDGSLLRAANTAANYDTPVLGINRGTLGFLTDINPDDAISEVEKILQGDYTEERRFFLHTRIHENGETVADSLALNDIVLLPGKEAATLIEFDIYLDKEFVAHQRSDGLIVATPTGSTAYALSAGGPIISPNLHAIVMVPMLPHTLSMRPIVVSAEKKIKVTISNDLETQPRVSCDGQKPISIPPGGHIHIDKSNLSLRLIHPNNYNYFETLRSKLQWSN